jgi:putative transposase
MPGKRHSSEEVATKMARSDKMLAEGKTQIAIAKALGVSVMTYHRWRKAHRSALNAISCPEADSDVGPSEKTELLKHISDLHIENSRLRRLVSDLLLETDKLEEKLALLPSWRLSETPTLPRRKTDVSPDTEQIVEGPSIAATKIR